MKNCYIIGILLFISESVFAVRQENVEWRSLTDGIEYRIIERFYADELTNRKVKLHVLRIKQGMFNILVHSLHRDDHKESINSYRKRNNYLIVLSGGFFEPDFHHPVGLVIEHGKELFPVSRHLSGVVWIKDGQLHLSGTENFQRLSTKPDYAIQGYPRIVDPINKVGIYKQRNIFAHRAAVCTTKKHFILMISDKSFSGLSLYEFALIAQMKESKGGLECDIAVNLDGGPAPGISVDKKLVALEVREGWQVPNVIAIGEKPGRVRYTKRKPKQ